MGQSGSAQLETVPAPVLTKPLPVKKVPPPRPSSPPKRPRSPPKGPKYAVPENRVLPVINLQFGQRKLRPVSQEISKVKYPEFADLFQKRDLEDEFENEGEEEPMDIAEEETKISDGFQKSANVIDVSADKMEKRSENMNNDVTSDRQPHGVIPNGAPSLYVRSVSTDESSLDKPDDPNLRRTHSLDRAPMRPKGHRRQSSRTTSLMNEEHTIFEDPRESLAENREHLYDQWRKDPYSNTPSNVVSLPVRTNFDIDVNYNMTYAQLAEHRRQKNLEELQKKTGISVESLQSDLTENSHIIYNPFNPFQRQASRESTRSTSTASSETGVSKRKKKRAPPPPGTQVDNVVDDEPPVDYDMDDLPMLEPKQFQRRMSATSAMSSVSSKSKPAPPPPVPSSETSVTIPKSPPSHVPQEILPSSDVSSSPSNSSLSPSQPIPPPPPPPSLESSVKSSQEQQAISKLDRLLSKENADEKPSDDELDNEASKPVKVSPGKSPEKRLSSLVNAQSESDDDPDKVRILKTKIPPLVLEKPKDESQLFREKLAKAYEERTKRREEEMKKKEEKEKLLKEKLAEQAKKEKEEEEEEGNMSARSEKKHGESVEILRRMSRDLDKKWLSEHRSQSPEAISAHELSSKESKSPGHSRFFSEDWTPEHDLDSDDDIEDRHVAYSHQRSTSEGFKSSIIPTKFNELKKNSKGTKSKYIRKQSDSSNDEKQKYGSIRKLKKTVHKGVKNAFGSISRASGKLLRKQKSMDFDEDLPLPPPPPSNWQLSASTHQLNGDVHQVERRLSQGNVLTTDESESESESEEILPQPEPVSNHTSRHRSEVNGHTQGPPSYLHNGTVDKQEDASRLYKKKKKKSGYITNGRQSEATESVVSEQIKEKRRQIEFERHRQLEIEREMLKLQALEDEERRQRLQTAHFQQQLQILQQSVGPGQSTVSAPPLPPTGGLHSYSVPDFTSHHMYPHMMNQGLPQPAMPSGMSFSNGNSGHAPGNLTSFDINYLSNLMRMNGVQPPSSTQQWSYLLGSVNLPTQPGPTKSMYPGSELPSTPHQVKSMYVTTPGPDLTKMFHGQSFDDSQLRTKRSMMDYLSARKQSQSFSNLTDHQIDPPQINNLLHEYEKSAGSHVPSLSEKVKQRSNPMYYSSDEDLTNSSSSSRTSHNYVASVHVKDYRAMSNLHHSAADSFMPGGDVRDPMYSAYHVQTSPSHRQRSPGEDSSSSGADR